jgi:hypothetical protein
MVLVIDLSSDFTSDSLYLLCPPRVLIEVNFPAFAHLVTVFGSTLNNAATSDGVRRFSWEEGESEWLFWLILFLLISLLTSLLGFVPSYRRKK